MTDPTFLKPIIVPLMGCSCVGKSSFIAHAIANHSDVGAVEVGKQMRAKYGAAYFRGQAAPKHTQAEAWDMLMTGIRQNIGNDGKKIILIDGQPRAVDQVESLVSDAFQPVLGQDVNFYFIMLHATLRCRQERALRYRSSDLDTFDLAWQRLTRDMQDNYDVLAELLKYRIRVKVVDTTEFGIAMPPTIVWNTLLGDIRQTAAFLTSPKTEPSPESLGAIQPEDIAG